MAGLHTREVQRVPSVKWNMIRRGELHSARRFEDGRFEVTPVRPLGAQAAREGGREGGAQDDAYGLKPGSHVTQCNVPGYRFSTQIQSAQTGKSAQTEARRSCAARRPQKVRSQSTTAHRATGRGLRSGSGATTAQNSGLTLGAFSSPGGIGDVRSVYFIYS